MHINIIHLPYRVDRRRLFEEQLNKEKVTEYTVWDGVVNPFVVEKGICKAHKKIVQYAKDKNLNEILIAEDDFKFTDTGAFRYFLENKPLTYDLYLASIYFGEINHHNEVEDFSGLTFYIIHSKFYDCFLSMPEHDNIDRSLRGKGKYIVCNPFTVIQQVGFSDNKKAYCNYENYLKGRILFKADL